MRAFDAPIRLAHRTGPTGFLDAYDGLAEDGQPPEEVAKAQVELLVQWVLERPAELFAELRAHRPILVTAGPVVVALYQDVMEVVDLDDVFGVEPYGVAMMRNNGGPNFILGMDDSEEFDHDLSLLKLAIKRSDLDGVSAFVAERAGELTADARASGRLELTDGYARLVPTLLAGHYFGVPGPDPQTLMTWCRRMFQDIFINFNGDPTIAEAGMQAGRELRAHVDELVAARHSESATAGHATVIDRLIAQQCDPDASFTDDRIRDNLIGCVVGVIDNINCAVANTVDVLLEHPDELQAAAAEARAGNDEAVLRYVLEALRFHPPAPLLVRKSLREEPLARGTARETVIPAGKLVFAANGSAMMDEVELANPLAFDLQRPWHHYLHFGWGMHECLGYHLALAQLTALVKPLLTLNGLRRAPDTDGELTYAGAFPEPFTVEFDPA